MTSRSTPIAVVGDLMLDHFVIGRVDRISPEAPVPVVRFERDEFRLGGAANVAANVRALDGVPLVVGCVGTDEMALTFRRLLRDRGISDERLVADGSRPTTRKVRVVTTRNQQVARVDYEEEAPLGGAVAASLAAAVTQACSDARAVVLSDYRKGVVTPAIITKTILLSATIFACVFFISTSLRAAAVLKVYTHADVNEMEKWAPEAEKVVGMKIEWSPRFTSTELWTRVQAETPNYLADMLWGFLNAHALIGAQRGFFMRYKSPTWADIPDRFKDPDGLWYGYNYWFACIAESIRNGWPRRIFLCPSPGMI